MSKIICFAAIIQKAMAGHCVCVVSACFFSYNSLIVCTLSHVYTPQEAYLSSYSPVKISNTTTFQSIADY